MSCKGKEKVNTTAGGKKSNANTFKVDKRPVQGMIDMDDPAARTVVLDGKLEKAIIGIGKINILDIENEIQFGRYNNRPLKISEVNKMITLFDKHGMQWMKSENAIAIVIEPARLAPGQMLEGRWNSPDMLTSIKLLDKKPIQLASGQHHVVALRKMINKYLKEEESLDKCLWRLQDKEALTDEEVVEHEKLRKRLEKVKGHIDEMGQWGVILYDIQIIDGEKDLGKHLSQNQVLHIYSETQEEQLQAAMKILEDQHKKTAVNKNSKLMKVLKQTHLMSVLMCDILTMGPHFRLCREFNVGWLSKLIQAVMGMYVRYMAQGIHVWRYLGAKVEDCSTLAEAKNMAEDLAQADDEGYTDALVHLLAITGKVLEVQDEDCLVFLLVMKEIDDVAAKCFKAYEGSLGARQSNYEEAGHWSPEEKRWHEDILGRVYIWLTDTQELDASKDGFSEIASWFECLLHTMKIYAGNSHAVDDDSEAIFSAIEQERGMDASEAAEGVFGSLWIWRTSGVLHLHNKMSEPDVQELMGKHPKTKDEFMMVWDAMLATTQNQAKTMYDQHKKFFGFGEIDLPISSMSMPCMHGLMVTRWDWQWATVKKNLPREAEPLVQAMFLEQHIAERYRPRILKDPIVWAIRDSIQKSMMDGIPQSKLKASTAGSLAKRKEWAYWDGITVDEPGEDLEVKDQIDAEAQARLVETNRHIAAEKADYDAILKIRKTIMSMPIARVTFHKKSRLTVEVVDAINQLTEALMISTSRQRKRFLSGVEMKEFDLMHDVMDLNIPDVEGLPDEYTIQSAVTGAEAEREGTNGDGADGDDKGEEETLPRATMKSPKGKGKVKEHAPAAAVTEASRDTNVEMEDALEKQVKPKPARPRPVPAKKTVKATPLAAKVTTEVKPQMDKIPQMVEMKVELRMKVEIIKMMVQMTVEMMVTQRMHKAQTHLWLPSSWTTTQ
ncbi:hypothetical protein EV702DRAFT_1201585 [Suillus placidus]|uniref:Uncharacterized protein n=1 Tax=Suillus placidus TaxID=48579 RepID=A0A9P6ZMQ9_9AGAM|nr:hypothetical protein EV702DRAFT_1201585 [Suillus placidus]